MVEVIHLHLDHRSVTMRRLFPALTADVLSSSSVRVILFRPIVDIAFLRRFARSRFYYASISVFVVCVLVLLVTPWTSPMPLDIAVMVITTVGLVGELTRVDRTLMMRLLRTFQFWLLFMSIAIATVSSKST